MRYLNKRANFDYQLLEKFEAGIVLHGDEVKAIRLGRVNLSESYVKIVNSEAILLNANIATTRTRKLLLHRKEIDSLIGKIKGKNLTLVPVSLYTKGRLVKLEIALAKSKREFEKKAKIRERDLERELKHGDD